MSIYDVLFVFGKPGSYVVDTPKKFIKRNIPSKLGSQLVPSDVQKVHSLAINAENDFFVTWTKSNGGRWWYSDGIESMDPALYEWQNKQSKEHQYCLMMTFGGERWKYAAVNTETGRWFIKGFEAMKKRINEHGGRLKVVALGMGDAYVVLFANNSTIWACGNKYPDLHKLLQETPYGDIVYVAMNPYSANEYFVLLRSGEVHIRASAIVERDVESIFEAMPNIRVISSTLSTYNREISSTAGLPPQSRTKAFLKGIATTTLNAVVGATITAVLAGCTVM